MSSPLFKNKKKNEFTTFLNIDSVWKNIHKKFLQKFFLQNFYKKFFVLKINMYLDYHKYVFEQLFYKNVFMVKRQKSFKSSKNIKKHLSTVFKKYTWRTYYLKTFV